MINLSEAWKNAYEEYLEEEYNSLDMDAIMVEMEAANTEAKRSFDLIEQFIMAQANESLLVEDVSAITPGTDGNKINDVVNNPQNGKPDLNGEVKMDLKSLVGALSKLDSSDGLNYKPLASVKVERIGDMKFPNNLIFFLKQLALWIRNVVIFFINKLLNAIRVLVGKPVRELDADKLRVNFNKVSKLKVTGANFNFGKDNQPEEVQKFLTVVDAPASTLTEATSARFLDLLGLKDHTDEPVTAPSETKEKIIVINVEKDLQDLRLLVEHFYNIFDSAYGTNNEYLFGTEDLKMIFNLFGVTLNKLTKGEIPNVALIGNHATELEAISPDVVRNNLRITSVNMDSLKDAYMTTANKIRMILQMIQSKEMMMLTSFGATMQTLSAGTLGTITAIASEIPQRQKQVKKLGKSLEKMKDMYSDLTKKIAKLQTSVVSLGTIQYSTIYNKRLQELFMASKDMTDIVTLRLTGVSLYCKELKEVQDILLALIRLNKYGK